MTRALPGLRGLRGAEDQQCPREATWYSPTLPSKPLACASGFSCPNKFPGRQCPPVLCATSHTPLLAYKAKLKQPRLAMHGSLLCSSLQEAIPLSPPPPPPTTSVLRPCLLSILPDRDLTERKRGLAAGMKAHRNYIPTQMSVLCCHSSGSRMIPSILCLQDHWSC